MNTDEAIDRRTTDAPIDDGTDARPPRAGWATNRSATTMIGRAGADAAKLFWKRRVRRRPDRYRATITFPTEAADAPSDAVVRERIDDLEHICEGRLDLYARRTGLTAVTDSIPAPQFDAAAFEDLLEALEGLYAGTRSVATLEKWRTIDGSVVKSYVVVPVRPLVPPTTEEDEVAAARVRAGGD